MHVFFAVLKPDEINGRLAALGGKLLAHLPNYFPVYRSLPVVKDESHQIFKVLVPDDLFDELHEGDNVQPRLWQGAKGQRTRPMDLVTVEVMAVGSTASDDLADLPANVQLAGAIIGNPDAVPAIAGRTLEQIRAWADDTLVQFSKG